jgi:hypothetical protein
VILSDFAPDTKLFDRLLLQHPSTVMRFTIGGARLFGLSLAAFRNTEVFLIIHTACERTVTMCSDQRQDTARFEFEFKSGREEVLMSAMCVDDSDDVGLYPTAVEWRR